MRSTEEKSKNKNDNNKLVKIIASPIRALGKARDMYIRSITNCGNHVSYGVPTEGEGRFSRSHSVATSTSTTSYVSEDYAELVRAASARSLINRIDMNSVLKQQQHQQQHQQVMNSKGLPKSSSVGMSRIDEDKPCDSEESVVVATNFYPRSRSYAVGVAKRQNL